MEINTPALHWIGPYRVLKKLGEGTQAEIYRVADGDTTYAAKIIRRDLLHEQARKSRVNDPRSSQYDPCMGLVEVARMRMFMDWKTDSLFDEQDGRECIVLSLDHGTTPYRFQVIDGERVSSRAISLEYNIIEEFPETLKDHITNEEHALSNLEQNVRIYAQVARALERLHAEGYVHCDVKPENIFLTERKHAKLGDFGIMGPRTIEAPLRGTPAYMPPELITDEPAPTFRDPAVLDPKRDVFALGVTIYEHLFGESLFGKGDIMRTLSRIKYSDYDALHKRIAQTLTRENTRMYIPSTLAPALIGALQKDPEKRFTSSRLFGKLGMAAERCVGRKLSLVERVRYLFSKPPTPK